MGYRTYRPPLARQISLELWDASMVWNGIGAHLKRPSHAHLDVYDTERFFYERTAHPLEERADLVAEEPAGDEDHPLRQLWPKLSELLIEI